VPDPQELEVVAGDARGGGPADVAAVALPAGRLSGPLLTLLEGMYVLGVTMAAELGVTPAQLVASIENAPSLAAALGSLITADTNGTPNGIVRRDTWEASYAALRKLLFPQLP
jgi:hypothetical protein